MAKSLFSSKVEACSIDLDWELSGRTHLSEPVSIISLSDSECEEDVDAVEEDDDFENVESLVNNLPQGMEIDLCPSGSIRDMRMKELVDDIEFVTEFKQEEDSDSDVSVDLEELANPRLIQRVMKRPEYSFRRKLLENSVDLLDDSKLWTESIMLFHRFPVHSEDDILYKKEDCDMTQSPLKLDEIPNNACTYCVEKKNAAKTPCLLQDDKLVNIFEEKNLVIVKPGNWKKLKEDPLFNTKFHLSADTTFNKPNKKLQ